LAKDWSAGLDPEELEGYPSAANPLTAMGIDPDEAAAKPELLAKASPQPAGQWQGVPYRLPPEQPGNASAKSAGAIGGAGDSSTQTTTSPTASPGADDVGMAALSKNLGTLGTVANAIPTSNPEVDRLTAERDKEALPTAAYGPDGKLLPQFKPSTGQKIWRGVRGGLIGLATGGIPGAIVGGLEPGDIRGGKAYNAPNAQYTRGEERREQQLGATNQSLAEARKNWEDSIKAMQTKGGLLKDSIGAANDMVRGMDASTLNSIKQQLADVAKVKESDQRESTLEKISNDLENKTRALDLRQMSIEQQGRIQDLANQIREQKLQSDKDKYALGTDEKSLEAERKARLGAIEDDWKAHPYINKIFGDKNKEIQIVNNDINSRLAASGVNAEVAAGPNRPVLRNPRIPVAPIGGGAAAPAANVISEEAAKAKGATHIVPGPDGRNHWANAAGTVDYGIAP
jgi:hypothetical protein